MIFMYFCPSHKNEKTIWIIWIFQSNDNWFIIFANTRLTTDTCIIGGIYFNCIYAVFHLFHRIDTICIKQNLFFHYASIRLEFRVGYLLLLIKIHIKNILTFWMLFSSSWIWQKKMKLFNFWLFKIQISLKIVSYYFLNPNYQIWL